MKNKILYILLAFLFQLINPKLIFAQVNCAGTVVYNHCDQYFQARINMDFSPMDCNSGNATAPTTINPTASHTFTVEEYNSRWDMDVCGNEIILNGRKYHEFYKAEIQTASGGAVNGFPVNYWTSANHQWSMTIPANSLAAGLYKIKLEYKFSAWDLFCAGTVATDYDGSNGYRQGREELIQWICVPGGSAGTGSLQITQYQECGRTKLTVQNPISPYTYEWKDDQGQNYGSGNFIYVDHSGDFYVRANYPGIGPVTAWTDNRINVSAIHPAQPNAPSVPTYNGSCGSTLQLIQTGTNYWQTSPTGTSKANSSLTWSPTPPYQPTYYIRAIDNLNCASNATPVTPQYSAMPPPVIEDQIICKCDHPSSFVHVAPTHPYNTNPSSPVVTYWFLDENGYFTDTYGVINDDNLSTYYDFPITGENGTYSVIAVYSNNGQVCYSDKVTFHIYYTSCSKCLNTLDLKAGTKYILSAWVKEGDNDINLGVTYNDAYIKVKFNETTTPLYLKAKGPIIDGWQKIEEQFEIPASGAQYVSIDLGNPSRGNTQPIYYDDIRLHPFNASMVSYVYDPITLKLVAELDANNYAKFYIHDDEGKMQKVNIETEKGIKTEKESRSSTVIKAP